VADANLKKATIPLASLPEISVPAEGYFVRSRVISEDRNRTSHWSQIFLLQPEYTFEPGQTSISKAANHVGLVWDPVKIFINNNFIRHALEYDIWLRWDRGDGGEWIYSGRIGGSPATFIIPATYFIDGVDEEKRPNQLTAEIFLKGRPIARTSDFLKVYTIGPEVV